ncbi:MAG: type II toxin-antitoxin system RelE/ParE family toxin [Polynucleobacter sp.]|jgi:proteic killer suppression protein|nr:type II toxin-antitoxin system RelE/ParE family toxin [Polynucleobacter sp.]
MIVHFKHRGLELFFTKGSFRGIPAQFASRLERLLDRLEAATFPKDMDLPGYKFHELKGRRKGIYAVTVSGNWRLTFEFNRDDVVNVDLEDYH